MFVPGNPFQPCLLFVDKASSLPYLKVSSIGQAPAIPTNIMLGWKGLPEANDLAYYENSELTAVKSFIILAPGQATS